MWAVLRFRKLAQGAVSRLPEGAARVGRARHVGRRPMLWKELYIDRVGALGRAGRWIGSFENLAGHVLTISIPVNLIAVATKLDSKTAAPAAKTTAAAAPAPALAHTVGASLKEFSINPTSTTAPAGRVTFRVRNSGTATHEFVVLRTNTPAGKLPLKNGRADST